MAAAGDTLLTATDAQLAALSKAEIDAEVARLLGEDGSDAVLAPPPPRPVLPVFADAATAMQVLRQTQSFIYAFSYDHVGGAYRLREGAPGRGGSHGARKRDRGLAHVALVAKAIIREALPIRCVDAVFLGIYATTGRRDIERFSLSFHSRAGCKVYQHIVLAVRVGEKWGALGISRRRCLAFKDVKHRSLSALVAEYRESYASVGHTLERVIVGLPVSHDIFSKAQVNWRALRLRVAPMRRRNAAADGDGDGNGIGDHDGCGDGTAAAAGAETRLATPREELEGDVFAEGDGDQENEQDAGNDGGAGDAAAGEPSAPDGGAGPAEHSAEELWEAALEVIDEFARKGEALRDVYNRTSRLPAAWKKQGDPVALRTRIRETGERVNR